MNDKFTTKAREILAPVQAEYDGGEPMLPGTLPEIVEALTTLHREAVIAELEALIPIGRLVPRDMVYAEVRVIRARIAELRRLGSKDE